MSIIDIVSEWDLKLAKPKAKKSFPGKHAALYDWLGTDEFSHSCKIRSGNILQSFVVKLVREAPTARVRLLGEDIEVEVDDDKSKEADVVYQIGDVIYYREIKGNTKLDSEKRPAVMEKIGEVMNGLKPGFPRKQVNAGFLCPPWLESNGDIEGLNPFITILGYNPLSLDAHTQLGLALGDKIRAAFVTAGR